MLSPLFSHLLIPFLVAMFLAINMGGSGTSPSFASAFGAQLIRRGRIPGLFGLMVFLGAIIAGKETALTIGKGIISPESMTLTITTCILFTVALTLLMANLLGIPQSTSQTTVFAISGAALYFGKLNTHKVFLEIIPTWFILPVISFIIMLLVGKSIYNPIRKSKYIDYDKLSQHPVLKFLVIISSMYVAFSIGANNVANASGPIASMVLNELELEPEGKNFILIILLSTLIIAPNFGIGSSIFGYKILKTTGKEIVTFGPVGATAVSFLTATLLLLASVFKGIPTSLVQLNTGAILALGVTKLGWKETFSKSTVKKFWIVWIIAPVIALIMSYFMIFLADKMDILYFE